jgi:hypothetical protein
MKPEILIAFFVGCLMLTGPARLEAAGASANAAREISANTCRLCGRGFQQEYRYCPYDGSSLAAVADGWPTVKEVMRDDGLIAYNNGIVEDTAAGLMWPAKDNSGNIAWPEAQNYAAGYRLGNYQDWRLPTVEELVSLFDRSKTNNTPATDYCASSNNRHLTELIHLSCAFVWVNIKLDGKGQDGTCARFSFENGMGEFVDCHEYEGARVLPVRGGR